MLKKILLIFLIIIIIFIGFLHAITPYIMGGKNSAQEYFVPLDLEFKESFHKINGTKLHSVQTGDTSSSKLILFIHGTPGSWIDFKTFLSDSILLNEFQLISIDRPGQGLSDYGQTMISIQEQSDIISDYLTSFDFESIILVGYSYGGPIAGLLASIGTLPVSKLVLLSPANGPDCEPIFWFNKLLDIKLIASVLPDFINVANTEKMQHAKGLEQISGIWKDINVPTIHIHSVEDWIAPFTCNVGFSEEMIDDTKLEIITIEDDPHFLPNDKTEFVKEYILKSN